VQYRLRTPRSDLEDGSFIVDSTFERRAVSNSAESCQADINGSPISSRMTRLGRP
jgi:hypothetical protein